jgi:two-component system NarL family response regulator
MNTPIRVVCVDDHGLMRDGIKLMLELQPDIKVVGTGANGEEALELCRRHHPDVVLMDLRMPGMSGLDAIRAIRSEDSEARIVVLTMYEGDEDIYGALKMGAAAYVLKDSLSDDLIRVVREVHAGERPMLAEVAVRLSTRLTQRSLTAREVDVLALVAKGMRNKEIADTLGISQETVQAHFRNIFTKLEVTDRTAALTVALRRGFIHL